MPLAALICYIALLAYPMPLFAFHHSYKQFNVYSDREIPVEIESILDTVQNNIQKSDLYNPEYQFNIFFCNESWRLTLLARNTNVGGNVSGVVSPNVFVRESDIKSNRIIPPNGWMHDADNRPLSYFLAHELTHSMQALYDRFMIVKVPRYVMEGYADYIGKGNRFSYNEFRQKYIEKHPYMQETSGLYNRYHLYIAHLMDVHGMSIEEIIETLPDEESIGEEILRGNIN